MVSEWSVREEIFAISQRWPLPFLAFLLGCLFGWAAAYVFPPSYQASVDLYVAYNADAIYRNPDDYKNWQVTQLNDLATAGDVLGETLHRLGESDPYWQAVTADQFKSMLGVFWRNTGKWRLTVSADQADRSAQAAQAWSEVFLEKYADAVASGLQMFEEEKLVQQLSYSVTGKEARRLELSAVRESLQHWQASIASLPAGQPLDTFERWRLYSFAGRAAALDPAWKAILDEFPSADAQLAAYAPWLERVRATLDGEIADLQAQVETLKPELAEAEAQYAQAVKSSRGLSTKLDVDRLSGAPPVVEQIRPASMMALVGGVLGFLVWAAVWLGRPAFRTHDE